MSCRDQTFWESFCKTSGSTEMLSDWLQKNVHEEKWERELQTDAGEIVVKLIEKGFLKAAASILKNVKDRNQLHFMVEYTVPTNIGKQRIQIGRFVCAREGDCNGFKITCKFLLYIFII